MGDGLEKPTTPLISSNRNSSGMSDKAPLIGFLCSVLGAVLSIVVYVVSSTLSDEQKAIIEVAAEKYGIDVPNPWVRDEVITLLIGFILGFVLLIVYIPVVMIEMGCCGFLGTVKETALKVAFEAKDKPVKVLLTLLSLLVFALVLVYLIHGEIVVREFKDATTGVLTIIAVILWLVNLAMSVIYLRK